MTKSFLLAPDLHEYLVAHGEPPDDVQRWLIDQTAGLGGVAMMQIAPEQGALMTMLTRLIAATNAVEVGTFTGYSALCIARGLAPGGRLLCCDVSDEWTTIGRQAWERAGVTDRIELRIAPALDTLRALPVEPSIDLAFIDADKPSYDAYYEGCLRLVRTGGVIAIDNTLWSGRVADPSVHDESTDAIRALNAKIAADERVEPVIVPVGDGLTLARRI